MTGCEWKSDPKLSSFNALQWKSDTLGHFAFWHPTTRITTSYCCSYCSYCSSSPKTRAECYRKVRELILILIQ